MMQTRNNLLAILLLFQCLLNAQAPQRFFTKFGGEGDDIGYSGKQTLDRQYIVAGSTSSFGSSSTDVYLVKVDSMGNVLWEKYYGGVGNEVGKAVIQLPDSGFVIAGFTSSYGAGGYDAIVIKTDKTGNLMWQKTFGGTDWDFAADVVFTSDGNIVMVGNTVSFGNGKKDGFAVKYDLQGNELWRKFYGGTENEELRAVIRTNDNMIATVGFTESRGDVNGDGYFLKLDLNGDTLFTKTFGGLYKDYANDLVQKSNGDYYIVGAKTFTTSNYLHSIMYGMSSAGTGFLDYSLLYGSENEEFISVTNFQFKSYLNAYARTITVPSFKKQFQVFTADPTGYHYIINASGGTEDETAYSLESTADLGLIGVGSTKSFGSNGLDVYFVKLDTTIINYNNVVGINEKIEEKPLMIVKNGILVVYSNSVFVNRIKVYNLTGELVAIYELKGTENEIEMKYLANNIYIFEAELSDGKIYRKKIASIHPE